MLLKPGTRLQETANRICQKLMLAVCILFGLAMIANIQVAGDGSWFWYATLFKQGKLLYTDMHLALQPWFVLETAWFMTVLGKGWLVSKVPALLHLIAYCVGMFLLARYSEFSDAQKAIIFGSAFFVSICTIAYRFDDYHVVAETFEIFSLVLLLILQHSATVKRGFNLSVALGILSGLTLTTRVTNGAALIVGVGIAILCLAPTKKVLLLLIFACATALTIFLVVHSTGDTFHDYVTTSVLKASGGKGGTANVLIYPFHLLRNTLPWAKTRIVYYLFGIALAWGFLVRPVISSPQRRDIARAAFGVFLILLLLYRKHLRLFSFGDEMITGATAVAVFIIYGAGIVAFCRFLYHEFDSRHPFRWNRREILLIIPFGQLVAMSMSTGGFHYGIYAPEAMLILLLPIASPIKIKSDWARSSLVAFLALLLCYCAVYRFREPYAWHSYRAQQMFVGRQWYRHPVYGPMIIESKLLEFIEPVCQEIDSDVGPKSLLGIPNPYGNYFCAVPPWHDDVQTYYDTTTKETVDRTISELQNAPPTWLFYQREPSSLATHEKVFNQGKPLPHRFLAELIEGKIRDGDWHEVYTSRYGNENEWDTEWILIRTKQ